MAAAGALDLLARFTLDAYLLARLRQSDAMPDGRTWERVVGELLWRPGLSRRQYAGSLFLFGMDSASGCRHELDAAADGWQGCLILEAKAKEGGLSKADVALFDLKTFDYFAGNLDAAKGGSWWRVLVSASEVQENLRRLLAQLGVVLCDPACLPLPVLVHAAGRPSADQFLPGPLLGEMIRLGEPALLPMQQRWRIEGEELRFRPRIFTRDDLDDLLWVQKELTGQLLDLYDLYRPGLLETRATAHLWRLEALADA